MPFSHKSYRFTVPVVNKLVNYCCVVWNISILNTVCVGDLGHPLLIAHNPCWGWIQMCLTFTLHSEENT